MFYLTAKIQGFDYYYNCLSGRLEGLKENATAFATYKEANFARGAIDDVAFMRIEGGEQISLPFNEAIRELRKRAGLSQAKAALAMGVCASTLSEYENASRLPGLDCICRMAKIFEITIEELVKGILPVEEKC